MAIVQNTSCVDLIGLLAQAHVKAIETNQIVFVVNMNDNELEGHIYRRGMGMCFSEIVARRQMELYQEKNIVTAIGYRIYPAGDIQWFHLKEK